VPRYYVHFAFEHTDPLPPVRELASVDADDPRSAVEALLKAGRVPQVPALRWARVVLSTHENGVPSQVMRFPITADEGAAIDWNLPGTDPVFSSRVAAGEPILRHGRDGPPSRRALRRVPINAAFLIASHGRSNYFGWPGKPLRARLRLSTRTKHATKP
jgi:hypothetical protein